MTVDIEKLEALAKAATKGEWSTSGSYISPTRKEGETTYVESWRSIALVHDDADRSFIAAANPAAVLELIAENKSGKSRLHEVAVACATAEQERNQLKAELAGLKTGYEAYERVNAELRAEAMQIAEIGEYFAGLAERRREQIEEMRKDAERYRWLREQEALEGGIAILPVGLWVKPAMLCTTPFDSGEMTDSVIDAAMSKEHSHD